MSRLSRLSATFALVVAATALTAGPALARTHDHDHMPDKWEKRNHLNLKKDDSRGDRDHDGLSNYGEYRAHTNPRRKDSDHDGRRDGREDFDRDHLRNADEIRTGFDPRHADSDNDGVKDGRENAGTIVKLSATSVTIRLAVGGSLTAGLDDSCSGSGSGSGDDTAPDPAEDAPDPGEDADPGDLPPLPDGEDPDAGDAPDPADQPFAAQAAQASGEDDATSEADLDQGDDATDEGPSCGDVALTVGATVHKAKVAHTAAGTMLVSVKLLG